MSSSDSDAGARAALEQHFQHVQDVDESIYLAIQIVGGHILLPLLVITILLKKTVNKHPVFVNFCVSWIFSSVVYSMLVYRGRSTDENFSLNPSGDSCLIQASLVNGAQALTTCTSLTLVVHLAYVLRLQFKYKYKTYPQVEKRVWSIAYNSVLLGIPFLAFLTFTVVTLVLGSPTAYSLQDQAYEPGSNLAVPGVFYCIIIQNTATQASLDPGLHILRATLLFSMIIAFITFGLEAFVVILIYRNRSGIKGSVNGAWIALFLRVALFSFYRVVALGLNLALILNPDEVLLVGIAKNNLFNGVIDYMQAAIPLVVFIVFATQRDILQAWCFWRRSTTKATPEKELQRSQSELSLNGGLKDFEIVA